MYTSITHVKSNWKASISGKIKISKQSQVSCVILYYLKVKDDGKGMLYLVLIRNLFDRTVVSFKGKSESFDK